MSVLLALQKTNQPTEHSSVIDSPTFGELHFNKGTKEIKQEKISTNVAGKIGQSIEKQSKTKQTKP